MCFITPVTGRVLTGKTAFAIANDRVIALRITATVVTASQYRLYALLVDWIVQLRAQICA